MKKSCLLLILLVLLICGCNNQSDEEDQGSMIGGKTMKEETMKEELVSKERLLEYIQTNDVGLSVEYFDVIDIAEYISSLNLTEDNMKEYIEWLVSGNYHLKDLEHWEKANYMAREKFNVDSTDEEYQEFINKFSQAIGKEIRDSQNHNMFSSNFEIEDDNRKTILYIERTKNIENLEFFERPNSSPRLLEIAVEAGGDGLRQLFLFCYSKNKKYILLADPYNEQQLEYIKKFQEIDD
ncbi:MAG: hypothetical protein FWC09_05155 [Lachnospiraceae bacterium]|nr:hypothetical protein [Lachnospiraceae bacterium]